MKTQTKVIIGVAAVAAAIGGYFIWKHHSSKKAPVAAAHADGQYENFTWPWSKKKEKKFPRTHTAPGFIQKAENAVENFFHLKKTT